MSESMKSRLIEACFVGVGVAVTWPILIWLVCGVLFPSAPFPEFTHNLSALWVPGTITGIFAALTAFRMSRPVKSSNV